MEELRHSYRRPGVRVLDVRSRAEYRQGHVPGSRNIPVAALERRPELYRPRLARYERIYIHCSSGERAQRAHDALSLDNLEVVRDSGMADWVAAGLPVERSISLARDLLTGFVAGLAGDLAAAQSDRALGRFVSTRQRLRERMVREGSPHEIAGEKFGIGQAAFTIAYGLAWGAIYAAVRRREPRATAAYGLPFAVGFFLACDGVMAPLLRLTPGLHRIPWQFNAKELANHVAWTLAAEAVHRVAERR